MLVTIQITCDTIGELQALTSKIVIDLKKEFDKEGLSLLDEPLKDIELFHEADYGDFSLALKSEYVEH